MIVVGGQIASESDPKGNLPKDVWPWGLGVFDMHDLQWKDHYDPEAGQYESPAMVKDWYLDGYDVIHPHTLGPREPANS